MTDLFISEAARGAGVADALIHSCADESALAGLADWCETKNKVNERLGAERPGRLFDYSLALASSSGKTLSSWSGCDDRAQYSASAPIFLT